MSDENDDEEPGEPFTVDFTIRIVNEDDEPVEGVRVYVTYLINTEFQTTDEDGVAHFSQVAFSKFMQGGLQVKDIGYDNISLEEDVFIEDGDARTYTLPSD